CDYCTISLHDALPICRRHRSQAARAATVERFGPDWLVRDPELALFPPRTALVWFRGSRRRFGVLDTWAAGAVLLDDRGRPRRTRSEEHTSELQSRENL